MPFNQPLTFDQRTVIDGGGYRGRDYIIFDPNVLVFQCHPALNVNEDVIGEFDYNSVEQGDYEDVRIGQTIIISETDDYRSTTLWRGRIRELPDADALYINEASVALNTTHYVTVLNTYEPMPVLRSGNYVDWDKTPEGLLPLIKNLQSAYFAEPDGSNEAEFTFSPTGQALEQGATIDDDAAWEWEINGVTYTTQEVTVTLAEGHYWARVSLTDSQPLTSYFAFQIIVADESSALLMRLDTDGHEVSGDWDNGYNANITYFAGIENVLDRTRVVIVSYHEYRDGDAELPNIAFVGYLRQGGDNARGDDTYATVGETRYSAAGFKAVVGEMPFSPIAIRNVASPALWDEINIPTTERAIAHVLTRYSNLLTLCAFDLGTLNNDHFGGDMDLSASMVMEACDSIASEINAQIIFAPCGQAILRRNAAFDSDDEVVALDKIAEGIRPDNMLVLDYDHPHIGKLAQIQIGFRSYYTADGSNFGVTATAPAVAYNDGMDFDTAPNQLLKANATQAEARAEAAQRAGQLLAYRDDGDEITVQLDGGWAWMVPSQHQLWSLYVEASTLTSGNGFNLTNLLLLKSVSCAYSAERGTRTVNATFKRHTRGGLAQIKVEVVPSVVQTQIQVHPPLSAYLGGLPPSPTLRTPLNVQKPQPYRPRGMAPFTPLPPAIADQIAESMGRAGCWVQNPPINFRNSTNVATNFLTVLGAPYSIQVKGNARISVDGWEQFFYFSGGQQGWSDYVGFALWMGSYWQSNTFLPGYQTCSITRTLPSFASSTLTSIAWAGHLAGTRSDGSSAFNVVIDSTLYQAINPAIAPIDYTFADSYIEFPPGFQPTSLQNLETATMTNLANPNTIDVIRLRGTGDNPFTGALGGNVFADAFYRWSLEDMSDAQLLSGLNGLLIDNAPVAVPPIFNPNHEYALGFEGTGNVALWRYGDTVGYTDNDNALLYLMICGQNAGN